MRFDSPLGTILERRPILMQTPAVVEYALLVLLILLLGVFTGLAVRAADRHHPLPR